MRIPKNSIIVNAGAVSEDTIVLVMKTPCRHYSKVEVKIQKDDTGKTGIVLSDVKNRCKLQVCNEALM